DYWKKELTDGSMKEKMVQASSEPALEYFDILQKEFMPAILKHDTKKAQEVLRGPLTQKYNDHRAVIDEVVKLATDKTSEDEDAAKSAITGRAILMLAVGIIFLLVSTIAAIVIARGITRPLVKTVKVLESVSTGDLTQR